MATRKRRQKGTGSIFKHGNNWYIAYSQNGTQIKEKVGPYKLITKGQAENALKARLGELVQGRFNLERNAPITHLFQLTNRYMDFCRLEHRDPKRDQIAMNHFKKFIGNKPISNITSLSIEKYKMKRVDDGVSRTTINREYIVLKSMFNRAKDWGILHSANPLDHVNKFKTHDRPIRVLTNDEYKKLYFSAAPHLKPILSCAYHTGMRKSEVLRLKWDDIDFNKNELLVRESKNLQWRYIPLNSELKNTFLGINKCNDSVFTYEGRPLKDFKRAFSTSIKRSEIAYCRFHDLRHTFATNLVSYGVDLVTVKELLGHKSIKSTMIYAHSTAENKKNAVNSLVKFKDIKFG